MDPNPRVDESAPRVQDPIRRPTARLTPTTPAYTLRRTPSCLLVPRGLSSGSLGFCGIEVVCVRGSAAGMDAGGTRSGWGRVGALWCWLVAADAQAYFGTRLGLAPGRRHDV